MRMYAILADIHGNYQALQAVVRDAQGVAKREQVKDLSFICLGDVVDYGPQPNECIAWVQQYTQLVIQGNHDQYVAAPLNEPPIGLNSDWWPITLWSRRVLKSKYKNKLQEWPSRQNHLPGLELFTLFHSSLEREHGYVNHVLAARENIESLHTPYGLFGHTHFQGYFIEQDDGKRLEPTIVTFLTVPNGTTPPHTSGWQPVRLGKWQALPAWGQRALFNPGSVGQPRRHGLLTGAGVPPDYRASYMLLRLNGHGKGEVQFRRVDYDIEKTIRLLRDEVRWPAATASESKGHSIYKDKTPPVLPSDPMQQILHNILVNIHQNLTDVIETKLIPALRQID